MLWLGVVTFLVGAVLTWITRNPDPRRPAMLRHLAYGVTSLGLGTLSMTQPGLGWIFASIVFSLVAIFFIGRVLWGMLKRK